MGVVPVASTPWTTFGLDFRGEACASCLQPLRPRFPFPAAGNAYIPCLAIVSVCLSGAIGCVARAAIPVMHINRMVHFTASLLWGRYRAS
jgi:hypothetical protein